DAIGRPGYQKHNHDEKNQAVHERRVSDEGLGFRVSQRRARRQCQEDKHEDDACESHQGEPQPARLLRGQARPFIPGRLPWYWPSRGSTNQSVTTVQTTISSTLDATPK